MKLGKIMIFVSDLDEEKRFYDGVLGFPVTSETGGRLEFAHNGVEFVAFKCEKNASVEDYGNVARSVFVFEVESVEAAFRNLRAKGVSFLHEKPAENDFS